MIYILTAALIFSLYKWFYWRKQYKLLGEEYTKNFGPPKNIVL